MRLEIEHVPISRHCYMVIIIAYVGPCVQIVQYMQQIYSSSLNLSLLSYKLTAHVSPLELKGTTLCFTIIPIINGISIFSVMRKSYIKDVIIQAVNCIVLPLVDFSVVLCQDKEIVFPQNRDIFACSK